MASRTQQLIHVDAIAPEFDGLTACVVTLSTKRRTNNWGTQAEGRVILCGVQFTQTRGDSHGSKCKPVPEGYHTITPYVVVDGAEKIIGFIKDAFAAQPLFDPMMRSDGKVMHAEFKIGDSIVMIADTSERAPATSTALYLYVPNVDAVYQKAIKAGATSLMEPQDQFYGDRSAAVRDAAGNRSFIGNPRRGRLPGRAEETRGAIHEAAEQGGGRVRRRLTPPTSAS